MTNPLHSTNPAELEALAKSYAVDNPMLSIKLYRKAGIIKAQRLYNLTPERIQAYRDDSGLQYTVRQVSTHASSTEPPRETYGQSVGVSKYIGSGKLNSFLPD